jgi:hypothetical protein
MRPSVAYAGAPIAFFFGGLQVGAQYTATFTGGLGLATARATGTVDLRRDLADGQTKPQLVVPLPALPLGPAAVVVRDADGAEVFRADDSQFTVAGTPLAMPGEYGNWVYPGAQAAVGRDGTIYLALDLTALQEPMVFEATAGGLPVRFTENDVIFRNVQGYLMQRLVQASGNKTEPVPGMFVFPPSLPTDSSVLHYSRHEFVTYFLQHQERQPHAVDPTDPNWHLDGSPHVDHDHLIIAITGTLFGVKLPAGATTPFDLRLSVYSLFYRGLAGVNSVQTAGDASVDSFDTDLGTYGSDGDVFTAGTLTMKDRSVIHGDTTAKTYAMSGLARVDGNRYTSGNPFTFMQIKVPTGIPSLGPIDLVGTSMTIVGPGSFRVDKLKADGATSRIFIDNSAGPVTLYVMNEVSITNGADVEVADPKPEKFAVYVASPKAVGIRGNGSTFYGVIYAPNSSITLNGTGSFVGAFVGQDVNVNQSSTVHYDSTLRAPE